MEYPRILNLIDDYLDRLAEARQVLLELNGDAKESQKRGSQAAVNKRALKAAARERQARLAFEITTSQPEQTHHRGKQRNQSRSVRSE
jgi:predicted O-methyltransferase YrrM